MITYYHLRNKYLVYCRIEVDGKREEMPTGVRLDRNQLGGALSHPLVWGGYLELVKGKGQEAQLMRARLHELRAALVGIYKPGMTAKNVREAYQAGGSSKSRFTLLTTFDYCMGQKLKIGEHTNNSNKLWQSVRNKLAGFLSETLHAEDIALKSFNRPVIRQFQEYCSSMSESSSHLYCQFISAAITFMMKEYPPHDFPEMPIVNPFTGFLKKPKSDNQKSRDNHLGSEIEQQLREIDIQEGAMTKARLIALLQWNTGMSFIDTINAPTEVLTSIQGVKFFSYCRVKTGVKCLIPIYPDLEGNVLTIALYNKWCETWKQVRTRYSIHRRELKRIRDIYGVKLSTRSHTYRHSFGVKMSQRGHSLEAIGAMMGHSPKTITGKIYVPITIDKIAEEYLTIINKTDGRSINDRSAGGIPQG